MASMLEDLLDTSRIALGKVSVQLERSIQELLTEALEERRPIEKAGLELAAAARGRAAPSGRPGPTSPDYRQPAFERHQVHAGRGTISSRSRSRRPRRDHSAGLRGRIRRAVRGQAVRAVHAAGAGARRAGRRARSRARDRQPTGRLQGGSLSATSAGPGQGALSGSRCLSARRRSLDLGRPQTGLDGATGGADDPPCGGQRGPRLRSGQRAGADGRFRGEASLSDGPSAMKQAAPLGPGYPPVRPGLARRGGWLCGGSRLPRRDLLESNAARWAFRL